MNKFLDSKVWLAAALAIACAVLFYFYKEVIQHPGNYLFGGGGDAVKNYFTFAWHVKYDESWLHFAGSNYPYGEHVCYTDGHPIVSLLLGNFEIVKENPIATLNILMLLSHIIGVFVVYRLLKLWGAKAFISALGSLSIIWLQPQIFRMEGHLSLSHVWVIPLCLLLVTKYWNKRSDLNLAVLLSYNFLVFFIHPYLGMMISMIPMCMGICILLAARFKPGDKGYWIKMLMAGVAPVFLYLLFMKATDSHRDRPDIATGFLDLISGVDKVFVPNHPPFRHLISQIIKVKGQEWEAWAYVGVATMLILLISLPMRIWKGPAIDQRDPFIRLILASSIIILLFSFGFPFAYGFEKLLDKLTYVQQFRAPGRFAWVFYFTVIPFVFLILNGWTQRMLQTKFKALAIILPLVVFGLFIVEGYHAQKGVAIRVCSHSNYLENPELANVQEALSHPELKQAQAIVPIPFFHFGSDFIGVNANDTTRVEAMSLALISRIPLVASANPRASLTESRNILALFGPAVGKKNILSDLQPNTAFYLFETNRTSEYPNDWYFPKKDRLWDMNHFEILHGKVNDLVHQGDSIGLGNLLYDCGMAGDSAHLIFEKFNFEKNDAGLQEYLVLNEFAAGVLDSNTEYEASVMVYAKDLHKVKLAMIFEKSGEKSEWLYTTHLSQSFTSYGDSSLVTIRFAASDSTSNYKLFLKNSERNPLPYTYGKCLVRPVNDILYQGKFPVSKGDFVQINHIPFKVD
jgi:hypothetical protein